jgi:hypothetical protein
MQEGKGGGACGRGAGGKGSLQGVARIDSPGGQAETTSHAGAVDDRCAPCVQLLAVCATVQHAGCQRVRCWHAACIGRSPAT